MAGCHMCQRQLHIGGEGLGSIFSLFWYVLIVLTPGAESGHPVRFGWCTPPWRTINSRIDICLLCTSLLYISPVNSLIGRTKEQRALAWRRDGDAELYLTWRDWNTGLWVDEIEVTVRRLNRAWVGLDKAPDSDFEFSRICYDMQVPAAMSVYVLACLSDRSAKWCGTI